MSGTLNVTNGTVRANIVAGGGVSTINLNGGKPLSQQHRWFVGR